MASFLIGLCFAGSASASTALPLGNETDVSKPAVRLALSEITDLSLEEESTKPEGSDVEMLPLPDAESNDTQETDGTDGETTPATDVKVLYDLQLLPEPVRRMRELIVGAASKGSIDELRPLLGTGTTRTQLSIAGDESDPIGYLREMSGDGNGQETLAILLDILNAGYVHVDPGEPTEIYLWPYFYALPLNQLDDRQKVELFRIVTAGDYEEMSVYGAYIFYRTGIGPEGDWRFFLAGD
ncbi:MAG: hypothetical protein AAGC96_20705 [Pseudomonadota bacterium]